MGLSKTIYKRVAVVTVAAAFGVTSVCPPSSWAGDISAAVLPPPGTMVALSPSYTPASLKGMVIHPKNALQFDFLIQRGDSGLEGTQKEREYLKLVKYFLASLTTPDKDQWVNLSPYEQGRIVEHNFGRTEMGRDLLSQDYLLKQITSSLMYPESNRGMVFWQKVYERAYKEYGHTNIPVNTFNKVWIIPDEATVYESGNTAYIVKNHLKVMLEQDYLSLTKHSPAVGEGNQAYGVTSQIIREIVVPQIEKEVNEGKNFAMLRQIYGAMLLAVWYKKALKESLLGKIYADKARVRGVDQDIRNNARIYEKYLAAFKRGAYNYVKEDFDPYTRQYIPRKYFAGGAVQNYARIAEVRRVTHPALMGELRRGPLSTLDRAVVALGEGVGDRAMASWDITNLQDWFRVRGHEVDFDALSGENRQRAMDILNGSERAPQKARLLRALGLGQKAAYDLARYQWEGTTGVGAEAPEPAALQADGAPMPTKHTFANRKEGLLRFLTSSEFIDTSGLDVSKGQHTVIDYGTGYLGLGAIEMGEAFSGYPGVKVIGTELASEAYDFDAVIKDSGAIGQMYAALGVRPVGDVREIHILGRRNPETSAVEIIEVFTALWDPKISKLVYDSLALPPYRTYTVGGRVETETTAYLHAVYERLVNVPVVADLRRRMEPGGQVPPGHSGVSEILPSLEKMLEPKGIGFRAIESLDAPVLDQPNAASLIVAGSVLVHMTRSQINQFRTMLTRTLKPGGIFVASAARVTGNLSMEELHVYKMTAGRLEYLGTTYINNTPQYNDELRDPGVVRTLGRVFRSDKDQLIGRNVRVRGIYNKEDLAMQASMALANPGGIDFNSANLFLHIKRDGKGVALPLAQQDMVQLNRIEGFVPRILDIRPAATLPVFSVVNPGPQARSQPQTGLAVPSQT